MDKSVECFSQITHEDNLMMSLRKSGKVVMSIGSTTGNRCQSLLKSGTINYRGKTNSVFSSFNKDLGIEIVGQKKSRFLNKSVMFQGNNHNELQNSLIGYMQNLNDPIIQEDSNIFDCKLLKVSTQNHNKKNKLVEPESPMKGITDQPYRKSIFHGNNQHKEEEMITQNLKDNDDALVILKESFGKLQTCYTNLLKKYTHTDKPLLTQFSTPIDISSKASPNEHHITKTNNLINSKIDFKQRELELEKTIITSNSKIQNLVPQLNLSLFIKKSKIRKLRDNHTPKFNNSKFLNLNKIFSPSSSSSL